MDKAKKSKGTKIPKPIKIKKEKAEDDRHPMSHYIDDRLELIKQIFSTLRPKTILNLAPDFLKEKSMVEIEEECLHELLCISSKRLLSIINATKCPTDTESDNDSDVRAEQEHVSLEEISSDSELETATTSKGKKKSTSRPAAKAKDLKSTSKKEENKGQISVLELLELQARARAIRSQLALEPITKIEVDSENDEKEATAGNGEKSKQTPTKERKRVNSGEEKRAAKDKAKIVDKAATAATSIEAPPTGKRIKLKRNFRISNKSAAEEERKQEQQLQVKAERKSRSASPDVIPIVAEPETLLISDSSDAESGGEKHKTKETTKAVENDKQAKKTQEIEEGELCETQKEVARIEVQSIEIWSAPEKRKESSEIEKENQAKEVMSANVDEKAQEPAEVQLMEAETELQDNSNKNVGALEQATSTLEENEEAAGSNAAIAAPPDDDDDQNDDIISIDGGGDLELEEDLKERSIIEEQEKQQQQQSKCEMPKDDDDIISLESSDNEGVMDEENHSESWRARYMRSSKVNKVLATSRLGKRVRDKIKKSKRSKKETTREKTPEKKERYKSKHEDGSVEQYKELLEMRQRQN